MLTRLSGRGEQCTRATASPVSEGEVLTRVVTLYAELVQLREATQVTVGSAVDAITVTPAQGIDSADGGRAAQQPEVALDRCLHAKGLLDEVRDEVAPFAQELLQVRVVTNHQLQGGTQKPDGGCSWPAAKTFVATRSRRR